jgi:hypothetical protein
MTESTMGTLENGLKREWLRLTAENAQLTRDLADTKAALVAMTKYRDGSEKNEKDALAEVERLRAALCDIRDARLNIPLQDIVANMRATAIVALRPRDGEQRGS